MRLNRRGVLLAAAALPLALAACSQSPAYMLRYALKIVIRAGDAEYSGRSVMQVDWTDNGWLAGFDALPKFSLSATAEAVIVDLGKAGLVFGVIRPPNGWSGFDASRPEKVLRGYLSPDLVARTAQAAPAGKNAALLLAGYQALEGEYQVPRIFWPSLVRFRDPRNRNDRRTGRRYAVAGPVGYGRDEGPHDIADHQRPRHGADRKSPAMGR